MVYTGAGRLVAKTQDWNWDNNRGMLNMEYAYSWSSRMYPGGTDLHQTHKPAFIKNHALRNSLCALIWDDAGNLSKATFFDNIGNFEHSRNLSWTEDNRLYTVADKQSFSYYAYDYTGQRTLKMTGDASTVDLNAQLQQIVSGLNRVTIYPSPYLVLTEQGYTKHYYAGSDRVCARLGSGGLDHDTACISRNEEVSTRVENLFWHGLKLMDAKEFKPEIIKELQLVDANGKELDWLKNVDIEKLLMRLRISVKPDPWSIHKIIDDLVRERPDDEPEVYFYHSDHLGGASWITDGSGKPVQHLQYLPFGEPFVDQHPAGYQERYTFTGKERDEETGYGYFGARYMDHELMTSWLSVDPMMDKYPSISPYAYCAWNPVKLVDPNGEDTLNYTTSHFLSTQLDISNALIINAHGSSTPPGIRNENIDYDEDLAWGSLIIHDATTVAECVWSSDVYQENKKNNQVTPVFLISCQTGETRVPYKQSFAEGLAQALDNTLIVAPVGDVYAQKGVMWLCPKEGESYNCYWRVLYNGQDIGCIEDSDVSNISTLLSGTQKIVNKYNANHQDNQIQLPNLNLQ